MSIYNPPNYGAQYPGSPIYGQPPATGQANRTPITPGPVTARANYTDTTSQAPVVATRVKVANAPNRTQVARPNNVPVTPPPAIGVSNHTPLITPLGTHPTYLTPTERWEYDYGNGGDGAGDGGP